MMKKSIESKRREEQEMVEEMIRLYCRKNHGTEDLCPDCEALFKYAGERSRKCPFIQTKTFCSNCRVHCYQPAMREKIREVMRFSGPRMLLPHPIWTVRHVLSTIREKRRKTYD